MLGAIEETGAEALNELGPGLIAGAALGLVVVGAFVLPLRQAIVGRLLHRSELAPAAFRWEDLFAAVALFLVATGVVIPLVGSYVLTGHWQPDDDAIERLQNVGFLGQAIQTTCAFLVPCLYIGWASMKRSRGAQALGVRSLTPQTIPLGRTATAIVSFVLGAPFFYGASLMTAAAYGLQGLDVPVQDVAVAISDEIETAPWRVALFAVVIIPFLEEVLFRGFLLELFRGKLGTVAGVVISSTLFALAHGLAAAPTIFVLAVVIAVVKLRTRSLFAAWVVHALNNSTSLFIQSQGLSQ